MKRLVQPEWLDALPPEDPRALRSRRDLLRINWWMRSAAIMAKVLEAQRPTFFLNREKLDAFPLTPTLSPTGEREKRSQLSGESVAGSCSITQKKSESSQRLFLLPKGEGQDEREVGEKSASDKPSKKTPAAAKGPASLTEIGAGDGKFLLSVAKQISARWPGTKVTLLDLQPVVASETLADFAALGWRAEVLTKDIFDWTTASAPGGIVIANLFLHHFANARLAELLRLIAAHAEMFVALEPRRARWPLFCSRLLWVIGGNDVTRHDATVSVRAGFSGEEISALWPDQNNWQLTEGRAGLFSHLFIARRRE